MDRLEVLRFYGVGLYALIDIQLVCYVANHIFDKLRIIICTLGNDLFIDRKSVVYGKIVDRGGGGMI